MRVLHVVPSLDPRMGGPSVAVVGLACAQARRGLHVAVACTYLAGERDADAVARLRSAGVHVEHIGPCLRLLRYSTRIRPRVRNLIRNADIVHSHAIWEQIQHVAARCAYAQNKPYIVRTCGMLDPWSLAQHPHRKWLYLRWRLEQNLQRATVVHFTSDLERERASTLRRFPTSIVEPNGLALTEFADPLPHGAFRRRFPAIAGRRIVLFLSRVHYKKGLDLLIPAFAQAAGPDCVLVIAGPEEGGYRATVDRLIEQHGLRDRTLLTGMLDSRARVEALVDADLFVLPSYQENFGVAAAEALAAGTPVILSDQVNIWQEIKAAGLGGVVPTQIQPLADELRHWLTDHAHREEAASLARRFAQVHFDWERIAERWEAHYRELCGPAFASRRRIAGGSWSGNPPASNSAARASARATV